MFVIVEFGKKEVNNSVFNSSNVIKKVIKYNGIKCGVMKSKTLNSTSI